MVDHPEEMTDSATEEALRLSQANGIEERDSNDPSIKVEGDTAQRELKRDVGTNLQDLRNTGHSEALPLTKKERRLYALMAEPIPKLVSSYEPCPFEYLPSRFLSLLPHPFRSACLLAASTLFDTMRGEDFLSETIRFSEMAGGGLSQGRNDDDVPVTAPSTPKAMKISTMTQSVVNGFEFVQNLTDAEVLKMCRKPAGVTVTRSFSVFSDPILKGNDYAAATCPNTKIVPGSFIIASANGSQSYLYKPLDDVPGGTQNELDEKLGIPQEVVTVQTTTVSAPKHWFCLRVPKEDDGDAAFLTEITGKRITIQHESTTNIARNPVRLKRKAESRRDAPSLSGKRH